MATVLVVEDDNDTRELLSRHLTRGGHHTVSAANGWEALLALDKQPVDLVLLDVMMPGMNGATFLRILRNASQTKGTPVVVVSALGREALESQVGQHGVQAILPKGDSCFSQLLPIVSRHAQPHHAN